MRAVAAPTPAEINAVASLYNQKEYDTAEVSARDLIKRFPKHGFGWKVLGAVFQSLGKIDESLNAKQISADLSPDDAEAWSNLGFAYYEQNRLDEAEKCAKHAIKISPKFAVAHNNLGITLEKLKRLEEAILDALIIVEDNVSGTYVLKEFIQKHLLQWYLHECNDLKQEVHSEIKKIM